MTFTQKLREKYRNSLAGKGATGRHQSRLLAFENPTAALEVARNIEHPWFRCQALSQLVAVDIQREDAEALLEEALSAAYSQAEPNRIAVVSRWPMQYLVSINQDVAAHHTKKLLQVIASEPHALRRISGLSGILEGVMSVADLRNRVMPLFIATADVSYGWRTDRIVCGKALALASHDFTLALKLANSRPDGRFRRRALKQLAAIQGELVVPT